MTGDAEEEPDFEPLSEGELAALSNEGLVAYIAAAQEAGELEEARTASGVLAYVFEPTIRAWVRGGMGSRGAADVEDVVMEVLLSVVRSSFDGKLVGEFGAYLKRITQRRVVDHFREGERRGKDDPLPAEHGGDETIWGEEPSEGDDAGLVAIRDAVARVLATRNEMHVKVIRLYGPGDAGFMDLSAEETAAAVDGDESEHTVSAANVHQIWKRFKTDLERELGLDG